MSEIITGLPVLNMLRDLGIFYFDYSANIGRLLIRECVDEVLEVTLTPNEVARLSQELWTVYKRMATVPESDPNLYTTGPDYDY